MTERERRIVWITLFLSIVAHAGVLGAAWLKPISSLNPGRNLFAEAIERQRRLSEARVERADRDLVVESPTQRLTDRQDPGEAPADEAASLEQTTEQLLENLQPSKVAASESPQPQLDDQPQPEPAAPAPGDAAAVPGEAHVFDATAQLLAAADPQVALPEYVPESDEAPAPGPAAEPIVAADAIDVGALRSLEGFLGAGSGVGGGGAGTGPGGADAGAGGADGPGAATGDDAAGDPFIPDPAETLALDTPALDLPANDLPTAEELEQIFVEAPAAAADEPTVELDQQFDTHLRTYRGPAQQPGFSLFGRPQVEPEPLGWFVLSASPRREVTDDLPILRKDVVWVIDTSSSIQDRWLKAVKAGVRSALDTLNEGDRFNVVMFSERIRLLSDNQLLTPTPGNLDAARRFLAAAETEGYTDVNQALTHLIRASLPDDRVYQIVFLSDGQPTRGAIQAERIIDVFTRENRLLAGIYCVAVGDEVNLPLLNALAYRNKGLVERPESWPKTAGVVRELASRLRYPILKDAQFEAVGVNPRQIYPRHPRDVHLGDTLRLYGRFAPNDQFVSMRISGVNGPRQASFMFRRPIAEAGVADAELPQRWARRKIAHLQSEALRLGDGQAARLRAEIEQIREKYGLD